MGIVFESVLADLLAAVSLVFALLYWYITKDYSFWKERKVPYLKPAPFTGNLTDFVFFRKSADQVFRKLYFQLSGHPFGGLFMFNKPVWLVRDPELIKNIFVKDFNHFVDHIAASEDSSDPFNKRTLFVMSGQSWKTMRTKLSPTFTSGKLKKMAYLICRCGETLVRHLDLPARTGEAVDMQEVMAKFTTDSVCSCAFGIDCSCLTSPESEFRKIGQKIFGSGIERCFAIGLFFIAPHVSDFFKFKFNPEDVQEFIRSAVGSTIRHREQSKVKRNDFIDILIDLKKHGKVSEDGDEVFEEPDVDSSLPGTNRDIEFGNDDIMAQAMLFFEAGFETSSKALTFTMYELAANTDIQERLRTEIETTLQKYSGQVSYEAIAEMDYLDRVLTETLRKYPPLSVLNRKCTEDYIIPGTETVIEKNSEVLISVSGIHHDPKFYPNPSKFDPERFTEENKRSRPNYTFLTFGEGPRFCIGTRFALLQVKIGLIHVLRNYKLVSSSKTHVKLDPYSFFAAVRGGLWLKVVKLENNPGVETVVAGNSKSS